MKRKGQPLVLKLLLTSKELYTGTKLQFIVNKRVDCPQCQSGYESQVLDIPAGTRNGEELVIEDGFNEYQNADPSDLVFKVHEMPVPGFERNGLTLIYRMTISLKEVGNHNQALLGFNKEFTNLDGQQVKVASNSDVTQHGHQIRIGQKGFKDQRSGAKGDLLVFCNIDMPRGVHPDKLRGSRYL